MIRTSAHKVIIEGVTDASGLVDLIVSAAVRADDVVAIIGKTEGNGGINDYTRILADRAFRDVLVEHGTRSVEDIAAIPMVWSGGCDGVLCPHATVFSRYEDEGLPVDVGQFGSRLSVGTALSDPILPEEIGRVAMVEKVADAVRSAVKDAQIDAVSDVHWVQTKTPLLTMEGVIEARQRGQEVVNDDVHRSMDISNGTSALGIAVALRELSEPVTDEVICSDFSLYSAVASCSSGVELDQAQVVVVGNSPQAVGAQRAGHSVMADALDAEAIYRALENAGLAFTERPVPGHLREQITNVFLKCEADPDALVRGRRQVLLNDSDVHHHRQIKAAVGGVAASAVGDPAVFVSVAAMHQGPPGGGPVMAIVSDPDSLS